MKRYFVAHIAPRDKTIELRMSLSATNFSYNLIDGEIFDGVFSILPTYVVGKHNFESTEKVQYIYSKCRWKNKILHKISPVVENFMLFRKIPKCSSVWFYNVSVLNVVAILLLLLFKRSVKVNLIVLDYTPGEFLNKCFLPIINKCHGRICLSTSELFNQDNAVCLPGVVPQEEFSYKKIDVINKSFLISGALRENIALISMLLDAFSRMPECTLHISGRLFIEKELIDLYTASYSNIIYHSTLDKAEYERLLQDCTFILSTRDPNYPENQCNFPSKIIEALLYNRIVLSTIAYPQLADIRYFNVSSSLDGFICDISRICSLSSEELLEYANQSELVRKKFSTEVWDQVMTKLENNN